MRGTLWIVAVAAAVATAACEDGGSVTDPEGTASISGRVESTVPAASLASFSLADAQSGGAVQSLDWPAAQASTVAAAAVRSDGTLEVLAEAAVRSDGRFTIEKVPAGLSSLLVSARNAAGAEVGRTIVHGETRSGAATQVAPINAETTVEGLVLSRLRAAGVPEEVIGTAELALLIRLGEASGAEVAASAQQIGAMANAVQRGAEARSQALSRLGARVDGVAVGNALRAAGEQHARRRDEGLARAEAQQEFAAEFLQALRQGGASSEQVALATIAGATALDRALGSANAAARLDVATAAVALNLEARSELLASLPASTAREQAAAGLEQAAARVQAANSLAELKSTLSDSQTQTAAAVEDALLQSILARLGNVPETVRSQIETRIADAFARADFGAAAGAASQPADIAEAVAAFRANVRAAVESLAQSAQGGGVDADAVTQLIVAVKGGPDLGS